VCRSILIFQRVPWTMCRCIMYGNRIAGDRILNAPSESHTYSARQRSTEIVSDYSCIHRLRIDPGLTMYGSGYGATGEQMIETSKTGGEGRSAHLVEEEEADDPSKLRRLGEMDQWSLSERGMGRRGRCQTGPIT
jgi:hypothetical protein